MMMLSANAKAPRSDSLLEAQSAAFDRLAIESTDDESSPTEFDGACQTAWPDTDSEGEFSPCFVKSVRCKRSGGMEKILHSLQLGATASSVTPQLRRKVCRFATNKVGHRVLELLLPKLDVAELRRVAAECLGEVADLSTQRYGHRTMRCLFAAMIQKPELHELVQTLAGELLADFQSLVLDPYGSLVLVDLVEGSQQLRRDVAEALLARDNVGFLTLCLQEYSWRVPAAALRHCSSAEVTGMADKLLARGTRILSFRAEGFPVLRALLENSAVAPRVKEQLTSDVAHLGRLKRSRHGRRLANDFGFAA